MWSYNLRVIFFAFCFSLGTINSGKSQNSSIEFWPEIDIWYRLNDSWRLSVLTPLTKYNESKYRDINIYFQADYAWGKTKYTFYRKLMDDNREQNIKAFLVRGGYMKGWSLGENAGAYSEDMVFAEIHKRIPLKGSLLLSQRIRVDTRWLGDDSDFSYRIRYRAMIEKEYELKKMSIIPYFNVEPYWDSRYSRIVKTRLIAGATVLQDSRLAIEGNLTYQYDEKYDTPNLYALNLILHVFLESRKSKPK